MTTSANAVFDPSRDTVITTALQMCQVLNAEQAPDAAQVAMAATFLNFAIKGLANDGVSLRVIERVGPVTLALGTQFITPATDTEDVRMVIITDTAGNDRELGRLTMDEYQVTSTKTVQAPPSQFLFTKENGNAQITLWPVNDGSAVSATYTRIRRLRDMDAGDVTLDLPQSWDLAIAYKLAAMLAPHFGMLDKAGLFEDLFEKEKERANMADTETGPVRFVPGEGVRYF